MNKIAVILPAYNEELTIKDCILDFHKSVPNAQIIIVNNNSSDETKKIAEETLKHHNIDGEVIDEDRQGKGYAVRTAFKKTEADIYILSDADLTYPASEALKMVEILIKNNADMIVGDRHSLGGYAKENKRKFHNFGNNIVAYLINKLFRSNLKDIMSGFRVFNRKFIKNYPILVNGFELETDMTLHSLDKRLKVVEHPIEYKDRPEGSESKLNTIADGAKVLFAIFQLLRHYRPMVFFGLLTIIFSILGIFSGIPAILDYIQTGFVEHLPLAVLATGLEVLALISLSIGLILDSINHQNRMNFEKNY
ncbi:glycosyltransferase family 2 protein [Sessilibacter sp. MAH1]